MSVEDPITARRLRRAAARALFGGAGRDSRELNPHELRALRRRYRLELDAQLMRQPLPEGTEEPPDEDGPLAEQLHWIEFAMVDEEGAPYPRERYEATLPDGSIRRGRLSAEGIVRFEGIREGGNVELTFPDLDMDAWEPR